MEYVYGYLVCSGLFAVIVGLKNLYIDKIPIKNWSAKRFVMFALLFPLVIIALVGQWLIENVFK